MREFIKSFFSFGFATSIEKLMAFLLLPIYTRFFTTADFGIIDLIQVIVGMVAVFGVLQLETAMQRYYFEYEGVRKKEFISSIFSIVVSISVVLALVVFIFATVLSRLLFDTEEHSKLVQLGAMQIPFVNFSMLSFIVLRYEKRNVRFVTLMIIKVLITLLFISIFVIGLKTGIYGVVLANLLGLFISSILLLFSVKDNLSIRFSLIGLRQSLNYSLPQFPARLGSVFLSYANRFFMIGYLSVAAIGIYSLSLKLASSVQLVYSAFVMAWAPFMFAQFKDPKHKLVFPKVLPIVASPVFFLVSSVTLFSREIVLLIATPEFLSAHYYLGGLCLFFSLYIFKEIVDIGPKYTEKTKYLSLTFTISLAVNILALYILTRRFELSGVVYSMVITNTVLFVVSWYVSNKLYYIPFKIFQFIILAVPAYIVSIAVMHIQIDLKHRILIFLILLLFYSVSFYRSFKKFSA